MTIKVICSIHDSAVNAYIRAFEAQTEEQAQRMFIDDVLKEGTPLNLHREDYALFRNGYFNDETGELIPDYKLILRGTSVAKAEKDDGQ